MRDIVVAMLNGAVLCEKIAQAIAALRNVAATMQLMLRYGL